MLFSEHLIYFPLPRCGWRTGECTVICFKPTASPTVLVLVGRSAFYPVVLVRDLGIRLDYLLLFPTYAQSSSLVAFLLLHIEYLKKLPFLYPITTFSVLCFHHHLFGLCKYFFSIFSPFSIVSLTPTWNLSEEL